MGGGEGEDGLSGIKGGIREGGLIKGWGEGGGYGGINAARIQTRILINP
jgi:hypothetical protein